MVMQVWQGPLGVELEKRDSPQPLPPWGHTDTVGVYTPVV